MTARILRNAAMLILAIGITLAGFEFWGRFGHALGVVLNMPSPSATTSTPPKDDGTVFVNIIPAKPAAKPQTNCPPKSTRPCK